MLHDYLAPFAAIGYAREIMACLASIALLGAATGNVEQAARLFGAAFAQRQGMAGAFNSPVQPMPSRGTTAGELTARETEILRLLVRRLTDKEIAAAFSISPRTVMNHVARILEKLGVASRREAAEWASRRDIM